MDDNLPSGLGGKELNVLSISETLNFREFKNKLSRLLWVRKHTDLRFDFCVSLPLYPSASQESRRSWAARPSLPAGTSEIPWPSKLWTGEPEPCGHQSAN